MTDSAPKTLVILLHGVGLNGADLEPLGQHWAEILPDAVFVSPNAPDRSNFGPGFQWFSIAGVTPENRPERIVAAREKFDALIGTIVAEHGFAEKLARVAFVGFSQGTIMSLDAVASGRWPVGAVVGFSGRLSSPEPLAPQGKPPVLLIHGSADPVIPATETQQAAARLTALGFVVETVIEPGLPHTISGQGAARGGEFLAKRLAERP